MKINLQPLYELRERLESSMVAGLSLLPDDFRLVRAVEQMEPLAGASPVFKRIYDTVKSALAPDCADKCGAVLDAYSLADAVLCTQGTAETEGEISNIPLAEGNGVLSNAPYSTLAPLLEALTTTGSGHYSTVVDMHGEHPELFQDYRLKDALVKGLGAGYSELADQIEKWLCEEGEDIIPMLKRDLNPRGKKEMVRRVHIIESVLKEKGNDYYISLLDAAEKEVREAVILALRHDQGNSRLLLDLTKAEKGNCKKAAQSALSYMDSPEALDYWRKSMKKKPGTAVQFLAFSASNEISDMVAAALEEMTDLMLGTIKENLLVSYDDIAAFNSLLSSLTGKSSPALCSWFRRAAQKPVSYALDKLRNYREGAVTFSAGCSNTYFSTYYGGSALPFSQTLPNVLTNAIICCPDQKLFDLADELFESVGIDYFKPAVIAAFLSKPSKEVYKRFVPYLENKKYFDVCLTVFHNQVLNYMSFNETSRKYEFYACIQDPLRYHDRGVPYCQELFEPLCLDWFQLFASGLFNRINRWGPYQFTRLIDEKDSRSCYIMGKFFYEIALDRSSDSRQFFFALKKCGWVGEKCKGLIVAAAKKNYIRSYHPFLTFVTSAPMTDEQKADELEQVAELVVKRKININGLDEQRIKNWCKELRAGRQVK